MRKRKMNRALLSVFLSALMMMSGSFQALASDITSDPKSVPEVGNVPIEDVVIEEKTDAVIAPVEAITEVEESKTASTAEVVAEAADDGVVEQVATVAEVAEVALPDPEISAETAPLNRVAVAEVNSEDKMLKNLWDWNLDLDCKIDWDWSGFPGLDCNSIPLGQLVRLDFEKKWHGSSIYPIIFVELFANDHKVAVIPISKLSKWKLSFYAPKNYLDKNAVKQYLTYTIKEVPIHGYETVITHKDEKNVFTAVRKFTIHNYMLGKLHVQKSWKNDDNNIEKRPTEVAYQILNGTTIVGDLRKLTLVGKWEDTLYLPIFDDSDKKIPYTIKELAVEGYETTYSYKEELEKKTCPVLHPDINKLSLVITNKWIGQEPGLLTINGEKSWNDLMYRPTSITVKLLRNGKWFKSKEVKVGEDGKWIYEFKDLEKFDKESKPYVYTIEEDTPLGYTVKADGYNLMNYQLRGKLVLNKVNNKKVGLPGATFEIYNIKGKLVKAVTTADDGVIKLDLPLGIYWVKETKAPVGYDLKIMYEMVFLVKDGQEVKLNIINTKSKANVLYVKKVWMDKNDELGLRPNLIEYQVLKNEILLDEIHQLTSDGGWEDTLELPLYDENNKKISYTVKELPLEGYEKTYKYTFNHGFNMGENKCCPIGNQTHQHAVITNCWNGKNIRNITLQKVWENTAGRVIPDKVTFQLYKDGVKYKTYDILKANDWKKNIVVLKLDNNQNPIVYTIEEISVASEYASVVNGFTITNTFKDIPTNEKTITLEKVWLNKGNRPLPLSVKFILDRGDEKPVTHEIFGTDGWKKNVQVEINNSEGGEYIYTVTEINDKAEYVDTVAVVGDVYTVTNTWKNIPDTGGDNDRSITLQKVWENTAGRVIPDKVTFQLYLNNIPYSTYDVTKEQDWKRTITVPNFSNYTVKEVGVANNYTSTVNGFTITNRFNTLPDTGNDNKIITLEKIWANTGNRVLPEKVTLQLYRDNVKFNTYEVTKADGWKKVIEVALRDGEQKLYNYRVEETNVDAGYVSAVVGFVVTNTWNGGLPNTGGETDQKTATLMVKKINDEKLALPGAVFEVYDLKGKLMNTMTTGADGTFKMVLPIGMYRVTETKAPTGYDKSNFSRLIDLQKNGETYTLEVVNTKSKPGALPNTGAGSTTAGQGYKPTLPKTGSSNQPILYVLGLFSIFAGGCELLRKKRIAK